MVFSLMVMPLDPEGNVTLVLQVAIIFLLVLGLPFVRRFRGEKGLLWHGYLTVLAVVLHSILIFVVMVPAFVVGVGGLGGTGLVDELTVWVHVVLGSVAEVLGVVLVAAWLRRGPAAMACAEWWRWMWPTFIIWVVSLVGGAVIHVVGMI
jgi:hypothetical protein